MILCELSCDDLSDSHDLMHLERELPFRMLLHIVDAAGEDKAVAGIIAHIARLQILIGGFQSIIVYLVSAIKDQLQLIHLLQGEFTTLRKVQLWRTGNPVDCPQEPRGCRWFPSKDNIPADAGAG